MRVDGIGCRSAIESTEGQVYSALRPTPQEATHGESVAQLLQPQAEIFQCNRTLRREAKLRILGLCTNLVQA